MPAEDLGERAKRLVLSALTEVFGHEPTLREWEETARETKKFVLLVPDDGREIFSYTKPGTGIKIKAEAITPLGKQIRVSGCCIFQTPKHPGDRHRPNSIWLEFNGEKHDFYTPDEHNLFRLEEAHQI